MAAGDVDVKITSLRSFGCAVFNGSNAKVNTSIYPRNFNTSKPFSISFWIKTPVTATNQGILARWKTSDPERDFSFSIVAADEKLEFCITTNGTNGGLKTAGSPNIVLTDNMWHHCVGIFDGSAIRAYVDNTVGTDTVATGNSQSTSDIIIGNSAKGTSSYFTGQICDVNIYDVALSSSEVEKLYNRSSVIRGLKHSYPLSGDYNDHTGNNNGTNSNCRLTIIDDAVAAVVKAQRTAASNTWFCSAGAKNQVITVGITEA